MHVISPRSPAGSTSSYRTERRSTKPERIRRGDHELDRYIALPGEIPHRGPDERVVLGRDQDDGQCRRRRVMHSARKIPLSRHLRHTVRIRRRQPDQLRNGPSGRAVGPEHRSFQRQSMLDLFRQDVRYAARALRRSPLFATVSVLSIAIGVGATTGIVTLANTLLLRPPPGVRSPERSPSDGRQTGADSIRSPTPTSSTTAPRRRCRDWRPFSSSRGR